MNKKFLFSFLLVLSICVISIFAQETTKKNPYVDGEKLVYIAKYKPIGLAFTVADINFHVTKSTDGENYIIKTKAKSRGSLSSLFSFKFTQDIETTINSKNLQILKTVKKDAQGKRVRTSEAVFDYENKKVTYVEIDPNDSARPPKRVASAIEPGVQDIVSGTYMLRKRAFAVGKAFKVKISDSGLVYDILVKVTARERKKSVLGKVWCWKIEPELFGKGKYVEQKGSLTIWITDDARRIPVHAALGTKYGKVQIRLKSISKERKNPMAEEVKTAGTIK